MIKEILKNKIAQNAGWLIGGRIAQMIISFFVSVFTARYLGPDNYGLIGYAGAYTAFFSSLCTLGINSVLVKELINHRETEGEVLGTAIFLKLISSIFSAIAIIGIALFADHGEPITIRVVSLYSIGVIFNVLETFNYWFQSKLKSKVTAIATLIGYIITAIYKIYLMVAGKNVIFFAFATSLDYIIVGAVLIIAYQKCGGKKLQFSWKYGKQLLSSSCHFILPALMVSIYGQTDKFMLKQMISETEIGYYTTAVSLCTVWCFVLQAIIDSLYPAIMEAHKNKNSIEYEQGNRTLYALVFYISLIVSFLICLVARPAIRSLFGDAYLPAVAPLRIITWYTAFSYLGVARNAWIVCEDKQNKLIWVYLSAAVSNVILNLIFIPFGGAAGAAMASLIAQIITTMVTPFLIKELRPNAILMIDGIMLRGIRHQIEDEK